VITTDQATADLAALARLSPREGEVLRKLASGATADEFSLSVKTVDTHRGNLLRKLNLRNNSDLTRFAIRVGEVVP
jgi:DNA-binding CsgD family transcriptional regulator